MALLANSVATGAALIAMIFAFAPISGGHFNPVVTLASAVERALDWREVFPYLAAQITGAFLGVILANLMFELPLLSLSTRVRTGPGQWLGEFIAAFGLLLVIHATGKTAAIVPLTVGLYITAAYWFTSSTSFANPAVTLARAFSDTFTGIRLIDVPAFVIAQIAGGLTASLLFRRMRS